MARYGDFVRYRPPLKATTALLWFGPFLLLIVGAVRARRLLRAPAVRNTPLRRHEAESERAAALLAQTEERR